MMMTVVGIVLRSLLVTTIAVGIVGYLLLDALSGLNAQNYRGQPARHDEAEDTCIRPAWERAATDEPGGSQMRAVDVEPSELARWRCIRV
jgi:hypothetical protein